MSPMVPHEHFTELRERIHGELRTLRPPRWEEQIKDFPWLYGALGSPGADVVFICENPSLTGCRKADNPRGGPPDFETQWTGDVARRRAPCMVIYMKTPRTGRSCTA